MALTLLQGMLGRQVEVELDLHSQFFGCGFDGILERVETIPSSGSGAIRACIRGGSGFFLDPAECVIYLVGREADENLLLEFHPPVGPEIAIRMVKWVPLVENEAP